MKLHFLIFFLITKVFSSTAITVEGDLIYDEKDNYLTLKTEEGDFSIINKSFNSFGCANGTFVMVNNLEDNDTYTLLEIIQCKKFKDGGKEVACTKNLEPSCGQPSNYCQNAEQCIQMVPVPKTYDNRCLLIKSGATYLYKGSCEG